MDFTNSSLPHTRQASASTFGSPSAALTERQPARASWPLAGCKSAGWGELLSWGRLQQSLGKWQGNKRQISSLFWETKRPPQPEKPRLSWGRGWGGGKQSRFSGAAGNFRCPTLGTENGLVKHAGTCPGEIRSRGKSPEVGESRALFPPHGEEKAGHPLPLENLGQTQVKREFCAWGARRSGGTWLKALSLKQTNAQSMF